MMFLKNQVNLQVQLSYIAFFIWQLLLMVKLAKYLRVDIFLTKLLYLYSVLPILFSVTRLLLLIINNFLSSDNVCLSV
jgi:hypothetical protein